VSRHELAETTPAAFMHLASPGPDRFGYAHDTDLEAEAPLLYSVVRLLKPRRVVELGTRHGISTRVLAEGLDGDGALYTIDPEDCRPHLDHVACTFIELPGEAAFERAPGLWADVLFIDTDPHSYDQTLGWLDTWVQHRLVAGGVAMFHDIVPARRDIRVADAVRDWLKPRRREGWSWVEYRPPRRRDLTYGPYGLGLLWRER